MPFGDRTGPQGLGPRTGRGAGYCSGFSGPGYMNPVPGRGWLGFGRGWFGRGRRWFGRGRGWRNWFWTTGLPGWGRAGYGYSPVEIGLTTKEEMDILKDQADFLKRQLDDVQSRINILEKAKAQESE